MERISKFQYYLDIAETVSKRSTCLNKHWGAVLVKDDEIISTGFNGAPRKCKDCLEKGYCNLYDYRRRNGLGRGTAYDQCVSVHAEMNAIIFADKNKIKGSALYLVGTECVDLDGTWNYVKNPMPCSECMKLIINAGIEKIYVKPSKDECTSYSVNYFINNEKELLGGYQNGK